MADNSVVQTIKDAEIDARSLSEFIYKPASFMVSRRLAPPVHTLDYYINYLSVTVPSNIQSIVQNAIDNTSVANSVVTDAMVAVENTTTQRTLNRGVESINDLLAINNPQNGLRVYVKSYHAGLNEGGGYFTYDNSKANINNKGTVINGWIRLDTSNLTVFDFGAISGESVSLAQKVGNRNALIEMSNTGFINLPKSKVFEVDSSVVISKSITINGNNSTIKFDSGYLHITGSESVTASSIDEAVYKNGFSIKTSALLDKNDFLLLSDESDSSFSRHRAYYRRGQISRVATSGTGVVKLLDALVQDYQASSTTKLKRLNMVSVNIKDINIITHSSSEGDIKSAYGLRLSYCDSPKLNNCYVKGGHYIALLTELSYGGEFNSCTGVCDAVARGPEDGTQYGLVFSDSMYCIANGGYYYGTRHGVAMGGAGRGLTYGCIVKKAKISSRGGITSEYSADYHGDVMGCSYVECDIKHGASIAGRDNNYIDCVIGQPQNGPCIALTEVVGGVFKIHGNTLNMREASGEVIPIRPTATEAFIKTDDDYFLDVANNVLECASDTLGFVMITPHANNIKLINPSIALKNNRFINAVGLNRVLYAPEASTGEKQTNPQFSRIIIDDVLHDSLSAQEVALYVGPNYFVSETVTKVPSLTKNVVLSTNLRESKADLVIQLPYTIEHLKYNASVNLSSLTTVEGGYLTALVTSKTYNSVTVSLHTPNLTTAIDRPLELSAQLTLGGTFVY